MPTHSAILVVRVPINYLPALSGLSVEFGFKLVIRLAKGAELPF